MDQVLDALPNDLYSVYGMTEMSGVFCALGPAEHRDSAKAELLASVGKPLPGNEIRVVNPATCEDLPTGEVGEFWVRSDQCMAGYWNKPDATRDTITDDGWLRTGDVGYRDADGYLFLTDRVKDMIISGGENIYPAEVERVLLEHPSVAEIAVIGGPDPQWGEMAKVVVVAESGAAVVSTEIIAFCRSRLAHYKCPTSVDVVDSLPRNATGKILKRELRAT
jgi:acyl-CoA synthetase (AMP-forming)/AMP-acid ligase II